MKKVVAVWDSAMQAYGQPIFVASHALALRSFTDEVNREAPENPMFAHADDFELHSLCSFEEEEGIFFEPKRECICRAKDVKK